jgi:hypothetical protein
MSGTGRIAISGKTGRKGKPVLDGKPKLSEKASRNSASGNDPIRSASFAAVMSIFSISLTYRFKRELRMLSILIFCRWPRLPTRDRGELSTERPPRQHSRLPHRQHKFKLFCITSPARDVFDRVQLVLNHHHFSRAFCPT